MSTLRERILESSDVPEEIVHVPEWGEDLLVVGMNGADRSKLLKRVTDQKSGEVDIESLYPLLIQNCARDPETRKRIFGQEDLPLINTKAASALERVGKVAMNLSGMREEKNESLGKPSSLTILSSTETDGSPSI